MGEAIGSIIGFIIVFGVPWYLSKKREEEQRRDMYRDLQKKHDAEVEKWRR